MSTEPQTHEDVEGATEDLQPAVLDPMTEYNAYRKAADTAYDDSIRAYDNMDKWMLTLAGGAFALSATLANNSSSISVLFYLGLLLFAFSTCVLLYSKYASYTMCEMSTNDIERAYQRSPDRFTADYYSSAVKEAEAFNRRNQVKNAVGLWTFIAGIACISLSLLPAVVCGQAERVKDDYSASRAAEANASSASAATSTQRSASTSTAAATASAP